MHCEGTIGVRLPFLRFCVGLVFNTAVPIVPACMYCHHYAAYAGPKHVQLRWRRVAGSSQGAARQPSDAALGLHFGVLRTAAFLVLLP